jgi:microcystin-dependent protein
MPGPTPYLGEIKIMACNFAPKGWALCNGQFLPINQNQPLFALLGTAYGGNGITTFALPDLRGRVPMHDETSSALGERGGEEVHTVTVNELPTHAHALQGTAAKGGVLLPTGNYLAATPNNAYHAPTNLAPLAPESLSAVGGSQPHENRQPYLVLSFCIALQGVFPSRN